LSDLWPGFEGLDKFFVVEYRKTGVSWRQVTIAQQVTMPNIANGTMFCAFDWPLNASHGFVSISWASCFLYCSISGNVGTNGLKEHCGVFTAIHYCTANDQLRVYSPFSGAAVLHLYGACIQIGTTGLKLDVNEWPFPFHQIDAVDNNCRLKFICAWPQWTVHRAAQRYVYFSDLLYCNVAGGLIVGV